MRMTLLVILTVVLTVCNIFFGAVHIDATEVMAVLCGANQTDDAVSFIIVESRIPQAVTALIAGGGLAVTGLMLQTLFHNPLAGPSILGITTGASVGVSVVMLLCGGMLTIGTSGLAGSVAITVGALTGSLVVMCLLMALAVRLRNNLSLLIVGMMVGYLASAVVSLLSSVATAHGVQSYVMWGMGTFGNVSPAQMPWFATISILSFLMAMLLSKPLNAMLLGDNYAANLGVNVVRVRNLLLAVTGVLSAVITAYCGPIGFIGLAMPHIARLLFCTDDHRTLMPATLLCGSIVALVCNLVSVAASSVVIPLNALTPIIGVPVVLYVVLKGRK